MKEGLVVLSLCDGMSCGRIALDRAGIKVSKYFASEIKDIAIKVTKDNYPNTIHIGSVTEISYKDGILHTEVGEFITSIDIVIFGSPCQTFSIAMISELRVGLENEEKSGLFLQCNRVLKEVNPEYFLMENVAKMKKDDEAFITSLMGVNPIRINSQLVSPQLRDRLYWTNIPNITIPENKCIRLEDILTSGYTDRENARALLVSDSRPLTSPVKMFHRYYSTGFTTLIFENKDSYDSCTRHYINNFKGLPGKEIEYSGDIYSGVRYMNQIELERCQTVPEGYTKCLTRNEAADVLGDGWTVDVIAHIFSFIPMEV